MSNPQFTAGQAWAAKRAEPKPAVVSVVEPAPYRPALTKCSGCGCWVPDTVPEARHGVRWLNVEGGMVLVNCSNQEVQP